MSGGSMGGAMSGESWALADDPQSLWCRGGVLLAEDSPHCCSAVCGLHCGNEATCDAARLAAINVSALER